MPILRNPVAEMSRLVGFFPLGNRSFGMRLYYSFRTCEVRSFSREQTSFFAKSANIFHGIANFELTGKNWLEFHIWIFRTRAVSEVVGI